MKNTNKVIEIRYNYIGSYNYIGKEKIDVKSEIVIDINKMFYKIDFIFNFNANNIDMYKKRYIYFEDNVYICFLINKLYNQYIIVEKEKVELDRLDIVLKELEEMKLAIGSIRQYIMNEKLDKLGLRYIDEYNTNSVEYTIDISMYNIENDICFKDIENIPDICIRQLSIKSINKSNEIHKDVLDSITKTISDLKKNDPQFYYLDKYLWLLGEKHNIKESYSCTYFIISYIIGFLIKILPNPLFKNVRKISIIHDEKFKDISLTNRTDLLPKNINLKSSQLEKLRNIYDGDIEISPNNYICLEYKNEILPFPQNMIEICTLSSNNRTLLKDVFKDQLKFI